MARTVEGQVAALERHKTFLDLARDDLGVELCRIATDGCLECIVGEHDPDGVPWPPLDAEYEAWKQAHYGGLPMGVLHFVMARPEEVAGVVAVTATTAMVTYGVSDQARQEAGWFQAWRRFWGFTDASREKVRAFLKGRFRAVVRG
jgi:hypothetical protein